MLPSEACVRSGDIRDDVNNNQTQKEKVKDKGGTAANDGRGDERRESRDTSQAPKRHPDPKDDSKVEKEPCKCLGGYKKRGNACFSEKDFTGADKIYTEAIDNFSSALSEDAECECPWYEHMCDVDRLVLGQIYTNRSATRFELGNYDSAVDDGEMATKVQPCYWKGHYRTAKAHEVLGEKEKAVQSLLRGVKLGLPEREQRCTMLVQALVMALKLKPDTVTQLMGGGDVIPYLSDVISLVQNQKQWQRVFRMLARDGEWWAAKVLLKNPEKEGDLISCGKQTHLKSLVLHAESGYYKYCDALARDLLLRGAHVQTLEMDGDPAVFAALRLGLRGPGGFCTFRYFMEHVLVRSDEERNKPNHRGRTILQFVEESGAERKLVNEAKRLMEMYGMGVTRTLGREFTEMMGLESVFLNNAATELSEDGEPDKAVMKLTEALYSLEHVISLGAMHSARQESEANIYYNRAGAYFSQDRLLEARLDIKRTTEIKPDMSDGWQRLYDLCDRLGMRKEMSRAGAQLVFVSSGDVADHLPSAETMARHVLKSSDRVSEEFMEIVSVIRISLAGWTEIVEELYEMKKWMVLSTLFSMKPEVQGALNHYTAEKLNLSRLSDHTQALSTSTLCLFAQLLERGADPESLVPCRHDLDTQLCASLIRGRPASYAFIEAVLRGMNNFLDCLLEREVELKEPRFPDPANLLHQMIVKYKSLSYSRRCMYIGALSSASVPYINDSELACRETLILGLNDPETVLYECCKAIMDRM